MLKAPPWLASLIDIVADCMEPHNELGPLAFRWGNEDDYWVIVVYPAPAELVGGAADGAVVSPGFSLDVQRLSTVLEELVAVHWQAHTFGPEDQDGPYISFEGVYCGHEVYLQILSVAPEDEEPRFKVDLTRRSGQP